MLLVRRGDSLSFFVLWLLNCHVNDEVGVVEHFDERLVVGKAWVDTECDRQLLNENVLEPHEFVSIQHSFELPRVIFVELGGADDILA